MARDSVVSKTLYAFKMEKQIFIRKDSLKFTSGHNMTSRYLQLIAKFDG